MKHLSSAICAALALASPQDGWRPAAVRLDGYSRNIALAVASTDDGFLSSAGGDVFPLSVDQDQGLVLGGGGPPHTWSTEGVVLDLTVVGEVFYAAAFRDGLRAFERGARGSTERHHPPPPGFEALTVTALDVGGARIVAFGTQANESAAGGAVHVLVHDSTGLRALADFDVGAPVFCLEAAATGAGTFALFVGTGCASVGGTSAALQRWDLRVEEGEPRALERRGVRAWSPPDVAGMPKPAVVRDLLLDPLSGLLIAAVFWDGVWAFEAGELAPVQEGGWPLALANDGESPWGCDCEQAGEVTPVAFHALALVEQEGERHLLAGAGPARTAVANIQFVSDLTLRAPCCETAPPPALHECPEEWRAYGLHAFRLRGGGVEREPVASLGRSGPRGGVVLVPFALAVGRASGGYRVCVASTGYGTHLVRASRTEGGWELVYEATWGPVAPARLPGPAFDDLLWLDADPPVLLASTESGIAVFPMVGGRPLAGPFDANAHNPTAPRWSRKGAILLAGLPGPSARVIASTGAGGRGRPGGLRFYDVSDAARPRAAGSVQLDRGGRGLPLCTASWSEPPGPGGELQRRLYSVQQVFEPGEASGRSSVLAWDVGSARAPLDPSAPADGAEPTPCNTGARCAGEFVPPASWGVRLGGVAALPDGERRVVYVLAYPGPSSADAPPGPVGLVVLEEQGGSLRLLADANPDGDRPGFLRASDADLTDVSESVRLRLDAGSRRLFATWVGHVAVWDVREPARPRLVGSRDLRSERANYGLTLSPVDMFGGPTRAGREHALLALLNDGLALLDVTDAASIRSAPLQRIEMPWQTTSLLRDPRDPERRTWFVGLGMGGLVQIELR